VGFGFGLGAGGEDAAADVAYEAIGLGDGAAGLDEAGGGVGCGEGLVGGENAVGEGGEHQRGVGCLAVGILAGAYLHGQVADDVAFGEAGLVAVLFDVPGEDADLVEVIGQAGFVGGEDGDVDGDGGDGIAVVENAGVGVVDVGEDVGADDALAFGVAEEGVGCGDFEEAAVDPAGLALGVADEPPVFIDGAGGWGVGVGGGGRELRAWRLSSGSDGLGDGGALQEAEGSVLGEQVELVGETAGSDVEVGFVAGGGGGDDGVLLVIFAEGVEFVGDVLGGGEAFFNPADFTARGANLDPAAGAVEDDELFAIGDGAGAVGDSSDAVAKVVLLGGDIDVFVRGVGTEAGAAGERAGKGYRYQDARAVLIHPLRGNLLHGWVMPFCVSARYG